MDQTTINQFFVARKSTFPTPFPPAKKVKLDGGYQTEKNVSIRRTSNKAKVKSKATLKDARTTKKAKVPSKCGQDFFRSNESPVGNKCLEKESKKHFTTPIRSCPVESVAKTSKTQTNRIVDGNNDDCSLIKKTLPKPQLTSDDLISDDQQAKTILLSRGSAILKAGYEKNLIKSPSKASEILSCLSPQKKAPDGKFSVVGSPNKMLSPLKSPSKLSDVLRTLTPKKEGIKTNSIRDDSKEIGTSTSRPVLDNTVPVSSRRDRLRNKFKHLLKEPDTVSMSKTSDISETKCDVIENAENVTCKAKAHDKFQHLVQKVPSSGFVFPRKFKVLVEMFRCVDSILFLLNQRSELCTFQKLKTSVQSMCSRNFELEHLAKIKTIYPNGFIFRQEKGLRSTAGSSKTFQLTVEANFKESMLTTSTKITSSVLITRRLKFENNLLVIMKKHHQDFLHKMKMKLDDSEIHRWHPHFKVDEVPDIDLSSLPQPPIVKEFKSAADLIRSNRNIAPKVHNALVGIANKEISQTAKKDNNSDCNVSKDTSSTTLKKSDTNTKLKGVSSSLLERIRQKEQNKMQLAMTRDPVKEDKLSKMERLPEICRILKSYFTTEKKVAITLEDCVQKLCESYGTSVNQGKLEEHVRLLADLVPDWLTIAMVRKFPFVKLSKGYDINKVINTLNNLRTKEMES